MFMNLNTIKLSIVMFLESCFAYLGKKRTTLGRILYVLYLILLVFFLYFILVVILNPYRYLKDFVLVLSNCIQLFLSVLMYHKKREIFDYLENLSLFHHIVISLTLLGIYYKSIKYIWVHKTKYLN